MGVLLPLELKHRRAFPIFEDFSQLRTSRHPRPTSSVRSSQHFSSPRIEEGSFMICEAEDRRLGFFEEGGLFVDVDFLENKHISIGEGVIIFRIRRTKNPSFNHRSSDTKIEEPFPVFVLQTRRSKKHNNFPIRLARK